MRRLFSFAVCVVLAVGCGSSEKSGGKPEGGSAGAGAGAGAGSSGTGHAGSLGGVESSGGASGAGSVSHAGASDLGGAGGAIDAGVAGGSDAAGAAGAPALVDPCEGKTCGGHGSCAAGRCSCTDGYDSTKECTSCSAGYTGYPNCITFPVCNPYENFLNGSVCRKCQAGDTTLCAAGDAGSDLCFCAKACPSSSCPALQGVQGQCRLVDVGLCFLSCAIANAGTNTGCPTGFTCRLTSGGGDAICIQD